MHYVLCTIYYGPSVPSIPPKPNLTNQPLYSCTPALLRPIGTAMKKSEWLPKVRAKKAGAREIVGALTSDQM
jgi:hypothetical protein